jgi:hypothetical protein
MNLRERWRTFWYEEYDLIISVPGEVTVYPDGKRVEAGAEKKFKVKKIIKQDPKHFIFIDMKGRRNEIRFTAPMPFQVIKIY